MGWEITTKLAIANAAVSYSPRWIEYNEEGECIGGKGILGKHSISLERMPEELRKQVIEWVKEIEIEHEQGAERVL